MNNILKQSIELLNQYNTEQENRNSQQVSFNEEHNQLIDDYNDECDKTIALESTLALNAIRNKELVKQLADAKKSLEAIEGVNVFLSERNKKLEGKEDYERRYNVAIADLARSKKQVDRLKSKAPKKVRQDKKQVSYDKLKAAYNANYSQLMEMLEHNELNPTWGGVLTHGEDKIEIIDAKFSPMDIEMPNGDIVTKMAHRLILSNNYNSVKAVYKVEGDTELKQMRIPKGKTIQIDQRAKDVCNTYYKNYAEFIKNKNANNGVKK